MFKWLIQYFKYSAEKGQRELYECKGHKGSVESIAVNSKQSHVRKNDSIHYRGFWTISSLRVRLAMVW